MIVGKLILFHIYLWRFTFRLRRCYDF